MDNENSMEPESVSLLTLCFSFLSPVHINYKYLQGTEEEMALRWKVILTALNTKYRGIRNTVGK